MAKIAVTGGGGFIGSGIVRELLARGDEVVVLGRNHYPDLEMLGAVCLQGDIADQEFVERAFTGVESVFHVAAKAGVWGKWADYVRSNVIGTVAVLKSCLRNGVANLVYTSTPSVVFGKDDLNGVDESCPYAKRSLCNYAASKIIAEKLVLRANCKRLKTVAIRPHLVWGPGDPHLIPRLIEKGKMGKLKIIGTGDNLVDICYIDNAVHAHILAGDNLVAGGNSAGRAFFIGQEKPVALWQWINKVYDRLVIPPVRRKIPFGLAYGFGAVLETFYHLTKEQKEPPMTRFVALQLARSHWFDHSAAKNILGYLPIVNIEEGLEKTVDYFSS